MKTLVKKAGFVVAATTATMLAVSPLAFAGAGKDDGKKGKDHGKKVVINESCINIANQNVTQTGLVNVAALNNINALNNILCGNDIVVQVNVAGNNTAAVD